MKALIIYGSYGSSAKLADIEKITDKEILKDFREPEKAYKITKEYLTCSYADVKKHLKDVNFYIDNIGFINRLQESYVVPITEEKFGILLNCLDEKYNDTINYYNKRFLEYKEANPFNRIIVLQKLLAEIERLDLSVRSTIYKNFGKVIKEVREKVTLKAKETGERQVLSKRNVPCNNPHIECNFDIITEYILPNGELVEERQHAY